jgi:hypothetical protein
MADLKMCSEKRIIFILAGAAGPKIRRRQSGTSRAALCERQSRKPVPLDF